VIHTLSVVFLLDAALKTGLPGPPRRMAGADDTLRSWANLARPKTKFTWNFDLPEKRIGQRGGIETLGTVGFAAGHCHVIRRHCAGEAARSW
jgi:hypothetical protein